MVKSDKLDINIARFLLFITLAGLIFTAAPVIKTFNEIPIYEIEMVRGSIIIIISGLLYGKEEKREKKEYLTTKSIVYKKADNLSDFLCYYEDEYIK